MALLFLLLNAVGVAIQGESMLWLVSAMLQGDGASHMQAYSAAQLEGLVRPSRPSGRQLASQSPSILRLRTIGWFSSAS